MSLVRADRIAESRKLESCSLAGYLSYALFVAALRDDFGRFRFSARCALPVLAPRDRADLTEDVVRALLDEYLAVGLLKTWKQDGVTWAEWTGAVTRGNRFHRTPEPPWSEHVCSSRCAKTGRAMAKRWGTPWRQPALVSGDGGGSPDAAPGDGAPLSALPSPPSPPSPSTTAPPQPPSAGADGGASPGPGQPLDQAGSSPEAMAERAARLVGPAVATASWQRALRRRIRARFAAGVAPPAVWDEISAELTRGRSQPPEADPELEPEAENLWSAICARLEGAVSPHVWASWFRPTRGLRLQPGLGSEVGGSGELVVLVPGPLHLDWLSRTYARQMLEAARAERPGLELRLLHAGAGPGAGVLVHDPGAAA